MKYKIIPLAVALVALLGAGYLTLEYVIFDRLTEVDAASSFNLPNTPNNFKVRGGTHLEFDTTAYEMQQYEDVRISSRQPGIQLDAWYIATDPAAPAVVLTHGFGQCKCDSNVLTAAGMLHRHGFNVLLIDLRNHGKSDIVNKRAGYGSYEYQDVLGAWDWLARQKGFPPRRIGLYGVSMGADSTLIALAQEPRIAAAFVDSPFFDVTDLLADELGRRNLPRVLAPGAILVGRLVTGDNLLLHSPQEGILLDKSRPIYLVQGTADQRVDVHHHYEYVALARQTGANVTDWVVEGAGHIESMFVAPADYEQRLVGFFQNALK